MKNKNGLSYLLVVLFYMMTCHHCVAPNNKKDEKSADLAGWQLIWQDEFAGDTLDLTKWQHETGGHGWGNNELQYYTQQRKNAFVEDGKLIIQAVKEPWEGREYTSARLNSRSGWTYKRIEARAKLPKGRGTWPAIWMLPDEWIYSNGSWPDNGEIDIMEHVGYDPGRVHATIHCDAFNHAQGTQKGASIFVPDAMSEFHNYAVEWYPDRLDFFMDDSLYFRFEKIDDSWRKWPFDHDFHLLLNIAVGGNWGGAQGVDDTVFPARMEIEYVRVYRKIE